jgi:hypothetical protein
MIHKWFYTGDDSGTAIYGIDIEENSISSMPADDVDKGIRIPFRLERNPKWRQDNVYFDPILFHANISWGGDKGLLRVAEARPVSDSSRHPYFDIPLSLDKVELIETLRQGKEAKFVLDVFGTFVVGGPGYSGVSSLFTTSVFNKHLVLAFTVPKSIWEDNVLPSLGIEALHSITIMIPPSLRKPFAGSLKELTEAVKALERATSEPDFESVVGKARITVESLLNQFTLRLPQKPDGTIDTSFRAKVEALRDQLLAPVLGKTHAEHIATVMIALWSPFSGAAHPGPTKFDRAYARFSIQQAAALLSVVSDALSA